MTCPLFQEFERQFVCGDYVTSRQVHCMILHRINEVAERERWEMVIPEIRLRLLPWVKPAYDMFNAYLDECHPHLKVVGRHGTCYATLEWHSLNMYLVVNGVTTEAVSRYIAADKIDRALFHAARMSGEFVYFSKCPHKMDETLPPVMLPQAVAVQEALPLALPEAMDFALFGDTPLSKLD